MTKNIYSCLSKEPGSELIDVSLVLADNPKKAREIAQKASEKGLVFEVAKIFEDISTALKSGFRCINFG